MLAFDIGLSLYCIVTACLSTYDVVSETLMLQRANESSKHWHSPGWWPSLHVHDRLTQLRCRTSW